LHRIFTICVFSSSFAFLYQSPSFFLHIVYRVQTKICIFIFEILLQYKNFALLPLKFSFNTKILRFYFKISLSHKIFAFLPHKKLCSHTNFSLIKSLKSNSKETTLNLLFQFLTAIVQACVCIAALVKTRTEYCDGLNPKHCHWSLGLAGANLGIILLYVAVMLIYMCCVAVSRCCKRVTNRV
jgi:hypothetical protein